MTTITELTVDQIKAEIAIQGDGAYFDTKFANWVSVNFRCYMPDAQNMIRLEAKEGLAQLKANNPHARNKEGLAQQVACERILNWLTTAGEYAVNTSDLRDLASFINSHRQACVWAVLIGKAVQA